MLVSHWNDDTPFSLFNTHINIDTVFLANLANNGNKDGEE